jgi:hypothetical protein
VVVGVVRSTSLGGQSSTTEVLRLVGVGRAQFPWRTSTSGSGKMIPQRNLARDGCGSESTHTGARLWSGEQWRYLGEVCRRNGLAEEVH